MEFINNLFPKEGFFAGDIDTVVGTVFLCGLLLYGCFWSYGWQNRSSDGCSGRDQNT